MDWKTIFMNISIDSVITYTWDKYWIIIPRDHVEELLWKELINLYRERWFDNVIVLNWPGGFTNLRVGTLCLNILNTLLENQLNFYDISKIGLYKKAYEKWFLPKYWVIYIWQKRNIRLRDFKRNEKIWQYTFNELKDLDEMKNVENVFIEDVEDKEYYPEWMDEYLKYHTLLNWTDIYLIDDKVADWKWIPIDEFDLKPLKSIAPNYMMDPSVTLK